MQEIHVAKILQQNVVEEYDIKYHLQRPWCCK